MKYIALLLLSLLLLSANGQSDDRVKLRDLQASPNPANTYIIRSLLDTSEWQLKSDFLFGIPSGSGTSGTLTKWTGTNTIGDAAITENATRLSASLPFRLANIPTISLPGVPLTGDQLFNTTTGHEWVYGTSSWLQGTFPTGTSAQTLRHDGSSWIANSVLTNDGTSVLVGASSYSGTAPKFYVEQSADNFIAEFRSTANVAFAPYSVMKLSRATSTVSYGGTFSWFFYNASNAFVDYARFGAVIEDNTTGSHGGRIVFYTTDAGTTTQERLRITKEGTIAINTTSPNTTYKLHTVGGALFDNTFLSSTSARYNLSTTTDAEYLGSLSTGFAEVVSRGSIRLWTDTNNNDASTSKEFSIYAGQTPAASDALITPLFTVLKNGNVGINTNSVSRALHVAGEARITDLTTDTPTRIVGADADGDLGAIAVGSGLSLSGGTLTATGGILFTQTANGTVANTVTETTVTATGEGTLTIPADYLEVGRTVTVKATGFVTTDDAHTLQMRVKLGGATIGDAGGITLPDLATANEHWELEFVFTIRTTGASGTAIGQGKFRFCEGIGGITPCVESEMLNTTTFTVDTTVANALDVTAEWGTASSTSSITCTNLVVKAEN